jgi:hypothetical protein
MGGGGTATPFLTSVLDGGEWPASRICRFTTEKYITQYPLDRLGGPQSQSGRCGGHKNLSLPGIKPGPSTPSLYRLSYPDSF